MFNLLQRLIKEIYKEKLIESFLLPTLSKLPSNPKSQTTRFTLTISELPVRNTQFEAKWPLKPFWKLKLTSSEAKKALWGPPNGPFGTSKKEFLLNKKSYTNIKILKSKPPRGGGSAQPVWGVFEAKLGGPKPNAGRNRVLP